MTRDGLRCSYVPNNGTRAVRSRRFVLFIRTERSPPARNDEVPRERADLSVLITMLDPELDHPPLDFRIADTACAHETRDASARL